MRRADALRHMAQYVGEWRIPRANIWHASLKSAPLAGCWHGVRNAQYSVKGKRIAMFEIRIHGRGGQGVVTAAELVSVAAFLDGKHAQAFPTFGSERMGAPVTAFCRISDQPIRSREPVAHPDALVIQDATLLHHVSVFEGLRSSGYILINSTRSFDELGLADIVRKTAPERCLAVPASRIAQEYLGRPLPNAVLLGALAGLTRQVDIDFAVAAIKQRFPGRMGEANAAAARAAYDLVTEKEMEHAQAS